MSSNRLEQQITFILEIDKLKSILRRSSLISGERVENSAEHSWHVALMALVLAEYAEEEMDILQVVKMLLIHDIVEIDAGDTYCYDEAGHEDKAERENQAAERIFGLLPADQGVELRNLWDAYEVGETPEARFAHALDRLMPLLHNYHNQGQTWQENGIVVAQVLERAKPIFNASDTLGNYTQTLIEDAVRQGYLAATEVPA